MHAAHYRSTSSLAAGGGSPDLLQAPPEAVEVVLPAALVLDQQQQRHVNPKVEPAVAHPKRDLLIVAVVVDGQVHARAQGGLPVACKLVVGARPVTGLVPARVDALQAKHVPDRADHLQRKERPQTDREDS
jgi:hypothetical protein